MGHWSEIKLQVTENSSEVELKKKILHQPDLYSIILFIFPSFILKLGDHRGKNVSYL